MKKRFMLLPLSLLGALMLTSCSFFDNFKGQSSSSLPSSSSSALYTEEVLSRPKEYYKATFYDYRGETVLFETSATAGSVVEYVGATPSKPAGEKRYYTFAGWDKELKMGKGNAAFYPTFEEHIQSHRVRFLVDDQVVSETDYSFGDKVKAPQLADYQRNQTISNKVVAGWDVDLNAFKVTRDTDIHAVMIDATSGLFFYETTFENTEFGIKATGMVLSGYGGSAKKVIIPEVYDGKPVIGIGDNAFAWNQYIESVFLPDSLIHIAPYAFQGCRNLSQIHFGTGLKVIDPGVFQQCEALETVVFNDGLKKIGSFAFEKSGIVSIGIPASVETIESNAFSGCPNLMKIDLSKCNAKFGSDVFSNSPILTEISFFDGMETIPSRLFAGCSALQNIVLPRHLKYIGDYAFSQLSSLISISLPNEVESIGNYAFGDCPKLERVTFPDSLTTLGDSVFANDTALKKVNLGENILSFGNGVFMGTPFYDNGAYLRDGIYYFPSANGHAHYIIGIYSSNNYSGNQTLANSRLLPTTKSIARGINFTQDTITIPSSLCGDLSFIKGSTFVSMILEDESKFKARQGCIYEGDTLYRCYGRTIKDLVLDPSTKAIASSAFSGLYGLDQITINEGLEKVDAYAFASTATQVIALPSSVKEVSLGLFGGESSNKFLLMAEGCNPTYTGKKEWGNLNVKVYENYSGHSGVFEGTKYFVCDNKAILYGYGRSASRYVELPSSIQGFTVTEIVDNFSWSDTWNLREVTLPSHLEKLGSNFASSTNEQYFSLLNMPSSISSIGTGIALGGGTIVLPTRIQTLARDTFRGNGNAKILLSTTFIPEGFAQGWSQGAKIYLYSDEPIYDNAHWHYVGSASGERVPEIYVQ